MQKLAVVTPYHNDIETIEAVMDGLISNNVALEWYLVDDASSKPPTPILEKLKDSGWFTYIRNEDNIGGAASLTLGIKCAIAEGANLIAINDADDISYPNRFPEQIKAFEEDPDLMVIGGAADMVDFDTGELLWRAYHPETDSEIRRKNRLNAAFVHSTITYRSGVFEKCGDYRANTIAYDYDFISRVLSHGCKARNLSSCVLKYNIRRNSISVSKRRRQVSYRLKTQLRVFDPLNVWSYIGVARTIAAYMVSSSVTNSTKSLLYQINSQ